MQLLGLRSVLGFVAIGLMLVGGCRSTTDRMRVIEAENADLERQNKDLKTDLASARARELQLEESMEKERARADAAQAKLNALARLTPRGGDLDGLREIGGDVQVTPRDDGGATIVLSSDVTFKAGRADLSKSALKILRKIATEVRQIDGVRGVRVEGHTDSDPIKKSGWRSNEELSEARAKMVRQYLISAGLREDYMKVKGWGASKPVASNKSKSGKAKNRRVEIILVK